jgi:hypothetical protein
MTKNGALKKRAVKKLKTSVLNAAFQTDQMDGFFKQMMVISRNFSSTPCPSAGSGFGCVCLGPQVCL